MKLLTAFFMLAFCHMSFGQDTSDVRITIDSLTKNESCYLIVGNSGGFAGSSTYYCFIKTKPVYKINSLTRVLQPLNQPTKRTMSLLLKKAKSLDMEEMPFQHPGNMSYFIEYRCKSHYGSATWGDPLYKAPESLISLYHSALDNVKQP